jgi:membrane protease YdiL (CAAX protease family)
MYASFATVTMLVLGLLIVLARASATMFDGTDERGDGESHGERESAASEVPATGAARVEQHPDTGQSRAERLEREILDSSETGGDDERPHADDSDGNPWVSPDDAETPWGENFAEEDARRRREQADPEQERDAIDAEPSPDDQIEGSDSPGDEIKAKGSLDDEIDFTTGTLLANVALSQGLFGAVIVGAAWLAEIPLAELGVVLGDPWNAGVPAVGVGVAVGIALYVGNELSAVIVDAADVDYSEGLRESLAPDDLRGWLVLLGVVLPVIASFEELLFRAALIGAFSAGFGVSPWLLAVFSTAAFAVGHGAQGPGGIAVTGLLGFALAAAYVLSGSLLVVVVAHYLVNALEFVVHEGFGIEWA